mgnify:CR=1 FL=1
MECKYEVENIFPTSLSFEEIRESVCEKIAKLIIIEENKIYTF